MARKARKISDTKVYHIMLRGINKQDIFLEEQDKYKFLKDLKDVKDKYNLELFAYCLMPNHVHLLIKDCDDLISDAMQSIGIRYSTYMNKKYERVGHLFQNRYLSKPVENKEYLLNLIKYIHQNPVKAGISTVDGYKWSSYREYIYHEKIIDSIPILNLFANDKWTALKNFIKYNRENIDISKEKEQEFEFVFRLKVSDDKIVKLIKEKLKIDNIYVIQQYQKEKRDKYIEKILQISGVNIRQVARVLGISERTIYRVNKLKK